MFVSRDVPFPSLRLWLAVFVLMLDSWMSVLCIIRRLKMVIADNEMGCGTEQGFPT